MGDDDSGFTRNVYYSRLELRTAIFHFVVNCTLAAMLGAIFGSLAIACFG